MGNAGSSLSEEEAATKLQAVYDAAQAGGRAPAGGFTTSGATVGEIKLFATLHLMRAVKPQVLARFPGLERFYERLRAQPLVAWVIEEGGRFPGRPRQYFVARGAEG